jgi:hypothetical protein
VGAHLTAGAARGCESAYDDNGAVGEADYLLSDAPEKEARHPAMTAVVYRVGQTGARNLSPQQVRRNSPGMPSAG